MFDKGLEVFIGGHDQLAGGSPRSKRLLDMRAHQNGRGPILLYNLKRLTNLQNIYMHMYTDYLPDVLPCPRLKDTYSFVGWPGAWSDFLNRHYSCSWITFLGLFVLRAQCFVYYGVLWTLLVATS